MEEPFLVVEFPQYIRAVKIANKRNAQHYSCDVAGNIILTKSEKVKSEYLTKEAKHSLQFGRTDYNIGDFTDNYTIGIYKGNVLVDQLIRESSILLYCKGGRTLKGWSNPAYKKIVINAITKSPLVVNEKTAGLPHYKIINGQDIYNGNYSPHLRASIMQAIKESFISRLHYLPIIDKSHLPCLIQLEVHDAIEQGNWDIDNRAYPYSKAFNDILSKGITGKKEKNKMPIQYFKPLMPDDNVNYIRQSGGARFFEIENTNDRKLVFKFYKDTYIPNFKLNNK